MTDFAVWAPLPKLVRLDVDGTLHDMTADDSWWRASVDCAADARYGFLLDDEPEVLPDPRSPRLRGYPDVMPHVDLEPEEVEAIATYLRSLR